jgi:hypothetical protein
MHPRILEGKLASIASRHLAGQHIDSAIGHFQKHLSEEVPPAQLAKMDDDGSWKDYANEFFKGCASAAPDIASASGSSSASSPSVAGWASSSRGVSKALIKAKTGLTW